MKLELADQPVPFKEEWPGELHAFSWADFVTAIPSPILLVTTYKDNGRENACLQSWSTFVGDGGEFICILGSVSKRGHLYQSLMQNRECVLNFPSLEIIDLCTQTIANNQVEYDEITKSGLTSEPGRRVNAPRVKECFLNIECELLWDKEHYEGSRDVVVALKAVHIAMDQDSCDESIKGRYGLTGYVYNIHSPRNPQTGAVYETCYGVVQKSK